MNTDLIYLIISLIVGFVLGCIVSYVIYRFKSKSVFENLIFDFKKSIDNLILQNSQNSQQIKTALDNTQKFEKILSNNQNLKGKYGEECLENIIKACYPNENVDYFKQFISKTNDGKQIKPDYVINLPNNKSVIIDCKFNLEKFSDYQNSVGSKPEAARKKELITDLNSTILDLSNKNYQNAVNLNSPDFVFMYVPLEPLISLIYTDSDIISVVKNAYEKNIIIVGNSGVLTAVRLVRDIWSNNIQEQNIEKIITIAKDLYSLIAQHSINMMNLKNKVDEFSTNFDSEFKKFSEQSKIFKLAQQLKDYGIDSNIKREGKKLKYQEIESEFLK